MNEEGGTKVRIKDATLKLDALSTIGAIEDSRESGSLVESMAPAKSEDRRINESENACDCEYTIKVFVVHLCARISSENCSLATRCS